MDNLSKGTVTWDSKYINPLRPPKVSVSGHAITGAYIENTTINLANTWGKDWNEQGNGDADFTNYKPTEAWIPYYNYVPSPIHVQLKNLTLEKTLLEKIISLFIKRKNMVTTEVTPTLTLDISKKWYQSKTVWFNVFSILAQIIAFLTGSITNPNILAYLMVAQSIVNLILRKVTVQPIN